MNRREGGGDNLVSDIQLFTLEILFVQNFPQFEAQTLSSILNGHKSYKRKKTFQNSYHHNVFFFFPGPVLKLTSHLSELDLKSKVILANFWQFLRSLGTLTCIHWKVLKWKKKQVGFILFNFCFLDFPALKDLIHFVKFLPRYLPPVDLHWFFEISIRTEKKNQLELKKKFNYKLTEKKFQLVYNWFFFQF